MKVERPERERRKEGKRVKSNKNCWLLYRPPAERGVTGGTSTHMLTSLELLHAPYANT